MNDCYEDSLYRREVKYLLTKEQFQMLISNDSIQTEKTPYEDSDVLSLYYDTPGYQIIRRSIEKPVFREKIRIRSYGIPGEDFPVFAEIKRKYEGVVYKRRTCLAYKNAIKLFSGEKSAGESQIEKEIGYAVSCYENLRPSMVISSFRQSFLIRSDGGDIRITADSDTRWRADRLDLTLGGDGKKLFPGFVILEIKCLTGVPLSLSKALDEKGCYPVSCSKYALAFSEMFVETGDFSIVGDNKSCLIFCLNQ